MKIRRDESLTVGVETSRRYEVMEMHLFDENASRERALCGDAGSSDGRIGLDYYMGQRKDGLGVGTVCEDCKAFVPPFARGRSRDLEADGRVDEAEEYRRLADMLLGETGSVVFSGPGDGASHPCARPFLRSGR